MRRMHAGRSGPQVPPPRSSHVRCWPPDQAPIPVLMSSELALGIPGTPRGLSALEAVTQGPGPADGWLVFNGGSFFLLGVRPARTFAQYPRPWCWTLSFLQILATVTSLLPSFGAMAVKGSDHVVEVVAVDGTDAKHEGLISSSSPCQQKAACTLVIVDVANLLFRWRP